MNNVFFSSDLHFCHDRNFIWGPRGFKSVYEMNEKIIEEWNKTIKKDDIVYLLGDIFLNSNSLGLKLLQKLNGKIHIAIGNHDTENRIKLFNECPNILDCSYGYRINYKKKTLLLTHYPTIVGNFDEDINSRKTINLCGHNHTKDKFLHWSQGCYHVELDAHNNRPVSLEEIMADIKNIH